LRAQQRAAGKAIKREIAGGEEGITRKDISDSIQNEYNEFKELASCENDDLRKIFPQNYSSIVSLNRMYGAMENGN